MLPLALTLPVFLEPPEGMGTSRLMGSRVPTAARARGETDTVSKARTVAKEGTATASAGPTAARDKPETDLGSRAPMVARDKAGTATANVVPTAARDKEGTDTGSRAPMAARDKVAEAGATADGAKVWLTVNVFMVP